MSPPNPRVRPPQICPFNGPMAPLFEKPKKKVFFFVMRPKIEKSPKNPQTLLAFFLRKLYPEKKNFPRPNQKLMGEALLSCF